jgi:hypothetical protein
MAHVSTRRSRSPITVAALAAVICVAVAACFAAGLFMFQPSRAAIWQALGVKCGVYGIGVPSPVATDAQTARTRAQCLADAWAHCRAASLVFTDGTNLYSSKTNNLVVEPAVLPWQSCQLADKVLETGQGRQSGTYVCAGLEVQASELLFRSCGAYGDLHAQYTLPSG